MTGFDLTQGVEDKYLICGIEEIEGNPDRRILYVAEMTDRQREEYRRLASDARIADDDLGRAIDEMTRVMDDNHGIARQWGQFVGAGINMLGRLRVLETYVRQFNTDFKVVVEAVGDLSIYHALFPRDTLDYRALGVLEVISVTNA